MATCGHVDFIATPPTLEFLFENFPRIPSNDKIDRSIPRCRLCDLIAAQLREEEAVSIENSRAVWKAEKDIKTTESVIRRGIAKEELEATLSQLSKTLDEALQARDQKIVDAWYEHWAIWGPAEGPEPTNEISRDDNEELSASIAIASEEEIPVKTAEITDEISWEEDEEKPTLPIKAILPPEPEVTPAERRTTPSRKAKSSRKTTRK